MTLIRGTTPHRARGRGARPALWLAAALVLALAPPRAFAAAQIEARLGAASIEAGTSVTLSVTIRNPTGGVGDPDVQLPAGVSVLGTDRSSNFSWVNGRANNESEYRYELGVENPGRYSIGPIRVRVGGQVFVTPVLPLLVTPASAHGRAGPPAGRVPATLSVELKPPHPYVGQLAQLTLRLLQAEDLQSSGGNSAPATPGFWSESWGEPIEYRTRMGSRPAYAVERRVRVYPLAPGTATIGSASILVVPGGSPVSDPFGGGFGAQPVQLVSESLRVAIAPLPAGAPPEFDGAVGEFTVSASLDRGHTARDQAITLRFDVRGTGNLPLLRTPALHASDFDVFASTVDDSLAPPGEVAAGRRAFQWTLLPKRNGTLRIAPPTFAWFDPRTAGWHRVTPPELSVDVIAAGPATAASGEDVLPGVFANDRPAPGARGAKPWVFAIAGALLGLAIRVWRSHGTPDPDAAERARGREYLRAVGLAKGLDFWRSADEASAWVEARGGQVLRLREEIAAARYSGGAGNEADVRRRLVERLGEVLPAPVTERPRALIAGALVLGALLACVFAWPTHGDERLAARARAADASARAHQVPQAEGEWRAVWREAPGDPALAARLAWAALRQDRLAEATAWAVRGDTGEPRDPALAFVAGRVREAGGMVGAPGRAVPLRSLEWAALAFALALGALLEWPRRWSTGVLAALALLAAGVPVAHAVLATHRDLAVVARATPLAGAGLDLDAGQVVRIRGQEAGAVRVWAGRDLSGTVPTAALIPVRESAK